MSRVSCLPIPPRLDGICLAALQGSILAVPLHHASTWRKRVEKSKEGLKESFWTGFGGLIDRLLLGFIKRVYGRNDG